jgi:phosphoglycerate kinase
MYTRENLTDLLTKYNINNLKDINTKRVLLRSCLNVAMDKSNNITDKSRLNEAYPTIKSLAEKSKRLIVMAHLGRPTGIDPKLSLRVVFEELHDKLLADTGIEMTFCEKLDDINTNTSKVILLENIRFIAVEESKSDLERLNLINNLAAYSDIFVNDAFPDYRESVSTFYIINKLPSYLGQNFVNDVMALSKLNTPNRPYLAILGGAKLSEKLDILNNLITVADKIIIGGAMAYTLLKAMNIGIGKSLYEPDKLEIAKELVTKYKDKIILPIDHIIADDFSENSAILSTNTVDVEIPNDKIALDIGERTIELYDSLVNDSQTILVNGPMGVYEWEKTNIGTKSLYESVVKNIHGYKLIGGGDSISAMNQFGITGFNHVSTAGGAMLMFLSQSKFPILDAILDQKVV